MADSADAGSERIQIFSRVHEQLDPNMPGYIPFSQPADVATLQTLPLGRQELPGQQHEIERLAEVGPIGHAVDSIQPATVAMELPTHDWDAIPLEFVQKLGFPGGTGSIRELELTVGRLASINPGSGGICGDE